MDPLLYKARKQRQATFTSPEPDISVAPSIVTRRRSIQVAQESSDASSSTPLPMKRRRKSEPAAKLRSPRNAPSSPATTSGRRKAKGLNGPPFSPRTKVADILDAMLRNNQLSEEEISDYHRELAEKRSFSQQDYDDLASRLGLSPNPFDGWDEAPPQFDWILSSTGTVRLSNSRWEHVSLMVGSSWGIYGQPAMHRTEAARVGIVLPIVGALANMFCGLIRNDAGCKMEATSISRGGRVEVELIAFMRTFFAIFEVKLHLSFLPKVLKPALAKLTAELISAGKTNAMRGIHTPILGCLTDGILFLFVQFHPRTRKFYKLRSLNLNAGSSENLLEAWTAYVESGLRTVCEYICQIFLEQMLHVVGAYGSLSTTRATQGDMRALSSAIASPAIPPIMLRSSSRNSTQGWRVAFKTLAYGYLQLREAGISEPLDQESLKKGFAAVRASVHLWPCGVQGILIPKIFKEDGSDDVSPEWEEWDGPQGLFAVFDKGIGGPEGKLCRSCGNALGHHTKEGRNKCRKAITDEFDDFDTQLSQLGSTQEAGEDR